MKELKVLYVKITDSCNLKCPFCYVQQKKSIADLDTIKKTIDFIEPYEVIFHGGEPMLYPDLILDVIEHCKNRNITTSITTNFMLELNEKRKEILDNCYIATSYSCDRFNDKQFETFINNTKNYNFTLLITLSEAQLNESPDILLSKIEKINPQNITFERLYDVTKKEDFYIKTDNYLSEIFKYIPEDKNNLLLQMKTAIKNNTNLFPIYCSKNVFTLNTDGSICNCPNMVQKHTRKHCLDCDLFMYCKKDCMSFQYNKCCFPKKTFRKVLRGEF